MVKIMKEPRNAILKQYEKLLELDEVKLEFADDALEAIAQKAMEKKTGARALRSILSFVRFSSEKIMGSLPKNSGIIPKLRRSSKVTCFRSWMRLSKSV